MESDLNMIGILKNGELLCALFEATIPVTHIPEDTYPRVTWSLHLLI